MAAIILAGGQSRRFGSDKALVPIGGVPLIERVMDAAEAACPCVFIIANEPEKYVRYKSRAEILRDEIPDQGPLGGLYTGLLASPDIDNILLPCDAPFISPDLIRLVLDNLSDSDAVVPRYGGRDHTALAGYSETCLAAVEKSLSAGRLRLVDFFDFVQVKYLDDDTIDKTDPGGHSFINVNTREDAERAEIIAATMTGG